MSGIVNRVFDLRPFVRDNKKGLLPIIAIEQPQDLGGCILENNRIQRFIPAEEITGSKQNDCIETEDDIEAVHAPLLREINGNKVGTTCRSVGAQTHRHHEPVDQTAENADQKRVIGDRMCRNQIRQETGQQDHLAG